MTRTASLADLAGAIDAGPLAGFRNAIINGNFDIWQRGTSFSNPADTTYSADRWYCNYNGTGATRTISRQSFTLGQTDVPGEPQYFVRFNQSVAGSGGSFNVYAQKIEGVRTFAGQQATLSFWARGGTNFSLVEVALNQIFGTGGSPSANVFGLITNNISVTTSWQKYSFTVNVPSIMGKTLGSNADDCLLIYFALPINTTFTFDLAQVQLEAGPVATPFERRPIGTELALCQRYYQTGAAKVSGYGAAQTQSLSSWIPFQVQMRDNPTMAYSSISYNNSSSLGADSVNRNGFITLGTVPVQGAYAVAFTWTSAIEL